MARCRQLLSVIGVFAVPPTIHHGLTWLGNQVVGDVAIVAPRMLLGLAVPSTASLASVVADLLMLSPLPPIVLRIEVRSQCMRRLITGLATARPGC